MSINILQAFIITVDEYMKFAAYFNIQDKKISDSCSNKEYVAIKTKLMLLRKCEAPGGAKAANIRNIIEFLKSNLGISGSELDDIENRFNNIQSKENDIRITLTDGSEMSLYEATENEMYGMYLHADIEKLEKMQYADTNLQFACVREYVQDLEKIVFDLYALVLRCGVEKINMSGDEKKTALKLSNRGNLREIKKSPVWGNIYGRDGTEEELQGIVNKLSAEELTVYKTAYRFVESITDSEDVSPYCKALEFVHPEAKNEFIQHGRD